MGRLRDAWHLLNLPCSGMTRLASESLDRHLGRLERAALRTHLLTCTPCRRYHHQVRGLGRVLRRFADPRPAATEEISTPGPTLPDDVRERIKQRIADQ